MLNLKKIVTKILLLILLAGCSTHYSFEKIVTPEMQAGIESELVKPIHKKPMKFDITQLGFKNENIKTLDELNKKYPSYSWNTSTYTLVSRRYYDDPARPGEDASYYYKGIKNAKRIAYRSVLTKENLKNLNNKYFGHKVIIYDIDDESTAQYSCINTKKEAPLGILMVPIVGAIASGVADAVHENDIENDQAYWSCSATVEVRLFYGRDIPWK